ncbi:zonadhesin-like [Ranitomeya imitator]|uniref:zonadhesin-like n=1 Tax=Ranitomeya imitator TaxID=111125 RepID=UPI0037E9072E
MKKKEEELIRRPSGESGAVAAGHAWEDGEEEIFGKWTEFEDDVTQPPTYSDNSCHLIRSTTHFCSDYKYLSPSKSLQLRGTIHIRDRSFQDDSEDTYKMQKRIAVNVFLILEIFTVFISAQESAALQPDSFCEPNKMFYQCKPCPRTCGDVNIPCLKICQPECYCKPGYVLASVNSNTCIPESQCTSCGPNAKFTDCNSRCQDTCDNYMEINRACPMMCQPGCVCEKGYVMYNNQCIKPILCPNRTRSLNPIFLPLLYGGASNTTNRAT